MKDPENQKHKEPLIKNLKKSPVILMTVLIIFSAAVNTSCKNKPMPPQTINMLGTVCTLNLYTDGTSKLYNEIFARITEIDEEFNVNLNKSIVSRINQNAGVKPVEASEDVIYVLKRALYFAEISEGAFDPTVGPLVKLWGINTEHARVPEQSEIDGALKLVDWKKIKMEGNTVYLENKGMSLDLGGIVKGFAADEIVRILEKHKVKAAIVDLGGNIYVYGKKENNAPWVIGIKNPVDKTKEPALLVQSSENVTVVTSGVYERFFEVNGVCFHHIIDCKTGWPVNNENLSTTIICKNSLTADALSTVSFILGQEKFASLNIEQFSELPAGGVVYIKRNSDISASNSLNGVIENYSSDFNPVTYF